MFNGNQTWDIFGGKMVGSRNSLNLDVSFTGQTLSIITQTARAQEMDFTCPAKAAITASTYFTLSSPTEDFYVWFNVGGSDVDPAIAGKTALEADISGDTTPTEVAVTVAAAIGGNAAFGGASAVAVVTVTNAANGSVDPVADVNAGITLVTMVESGLLAGDIMFNAVPTGCSKLFEILDVELQDSAACDVTLLGVFKDNVETGSMVLETYTNITSWTVTRMVLTDEVNLDTAVVV